MLHLAIMAASALLLLTIHMTPLVTVQHQKKLPMLLFKEAVPSHRNLTFAGRGLVQRRSSSKSSHHQGSQQYTRVSHERRRLDKASTEQTRGRGTCSGLCVEKTAEAEKEMSEVLVEDSYSSLTRRQTLMTLMD